MICPLCHQDLGESIIQRGNNPLSVQVQRPVIRWMQNDDVVLAHKDCVEKYLAGPEPHHNED